jgi:hypothetical protein
MNRFLLLWLFFALSIPLPALSAERNVTGSNVHAVYLAIGHIYSKSKVDELIEIIKNTGANAVVIDFKDSNVPDMKRMRELTARFRDANAYTIARIVVMQDSLYARKHPEIAIKSAGGGFWYSGRSSWKRYWLDPAANLTQEYAIATAKLAIDAGFNEVQFDYMRFPTDGNMKNIVYPAYRGAQSKSDVMRGFFERIHHELKAYNANVILSIDVFGEVLLYGKERGIGQNAADVGKYFDVVSPMAYPSHYQCGEFGVRDPTAHPYKVYFDTIRKGQGYLSGTNAIIRPWVQDFTLTSIYHCGPRVVYTAERIREQIRAGEDLGVHGFMLWNAGSRFTRGAFN